jgi:hypothetical protein
MIRYVISFPAEAKIRAEQMHYFAEMLKECANAREWRDIVLNEGATITDMRRTRPVLALVRRARARAR